MITNDQWELIDEKYGKLLTTICSKISGDAAIANFDDNLQDLRLAAMEAVAGFARKEQKPFAEFWDTVGFNKYMKTCLWNLKNKKGSRITKRYNINKNTVDITEYSEILVAENHDTSTTSLDFVLGESVSKFSDDQINAIKTVMDNPHFVKPNGKVNVRRLSTELGYCAAKTRKILDGIKTQLSLDV
jgi:hypothetical protein